MLHYVVANRKIILSSDYYDLVIRPVANDQTIRIVNEFLRGLHTEEITIQLLLTQRLKDQYAFKTNKALNILSFKEIFFMNRQVPELVDSYDYEVIRLINEKYNMSFMDALRAFVSSKTHRMLIDADYGFTMFGAPGVFDIWEAEIVTGDPRNSTYIRGYIYEFKFK